MPEATPPSMPLWQCPIVGARMPAITRVKTAKVPFALATEKRSLVITRPGVPAPAVPEIALRLPAPRKVRGPIVSLPVRQRFGRRPKDLNYRDNGGEITVRWSQHGNGALLSHDLNLVST